MKNVYLTKCYGTNSRPGQRFSIYWPHLKIIFIQRKRTFIAVIILVKYTLLIYLKILRYNYCNSFKLI